MRATCHCSCQLPAPAMLLRHFNWGWCAVVITWCHTVAVSSSSSSNQWKTHSERWLQRYTFTAAVHTSHTPFVYVEPEQAALLVGKSIFRSVIMIVIVIIRQAQTDLRQRYKFVSFVLLLHSFFLFLPCNLSQVRLQISTLSNFLYICVAFSRG